MLIQDHPPYLLLLIATILTFFSYRKAALILIAVAVGRALTLDILAPLAMIPLGLLAVSVWSFERRLGPPWMKWVQLSAILVLALGLMSHQFPGFSNILVFDKIQFSADAAPFTMFLNFDKIMAGLLVLIFVVKPAQWELFGRSDIKITLRTLVVLSLLLIPIAMALGYVRFDQKEVPWIWLVNNLFFVCVAEEVIFRGFLQNRLMLLRPASESWRWISVAIAAIAFGLAHFAGGPINVVLATLAGCAYGFVYLKSSKIEAAIFVHFGFNLIHFAAFTYPALASAAAGSGQ